MLKNSSSIKNEDKNLKEDNIKVNSAIGVLKSKIPTLASIQISNKSIENNQTKLKNVA